MDTDYFMFNLPVTKLITIAKSAERELLKIYFSECKSPEEIKKRTSRFLRKPANNVEAEE